MGAWTPRQRAFRLESGTGRFPKAKRAAWYRRLQEAYWQSTCRNGQYAIAQDLIQEAIAIYTVQGKPHSRAAALGTLADVLVMRGEVNKAMQFYDEALALSHDAKHAGWVTQIESRLKQLQQNY